MSPGQTAVVTIILSSLGVVFIPLLIMLYRGIVKWTRVEDKLNELVTDMKQIVADKDATHRDLISQMGRDRDATDRRLRWLEENTWQKK